MSLTAACAILAVMLLRPLVRRAPRTVTYLLWAAVLFRLICPVSFSMDFSLLFGKGTVDNRIRYLPAELTADSARFSSAKTAAQVSETALDAFTLMDFSRMAIVVGTWVWLAGIAAFLIYTIISLVQMHRQCICAVCLEENIWLADGIDVPFILGIFRPNIYLPSVLSDSERRCIVLHEQAHIRRGDPLWKLIAFLALGVHWFNPMVWIGFHLFVRDMEIACDERVLKTMNADACADYAETLLRISSGRRPPSISPAFGEDSPKTRIKRILRYKKPMKIVTLCTAAFAVVFSVLLIANPQAETGRAADVIPEFPRLSDQVQYYALDFEAVPNENDAFFYSSVDPAVTRTIYNFLENLVVEAEPSDQSRAEDRDQSRTLNIGTASNSATRIHFNTKLTRMWIDNGVKPSYTYTVTDPNAVDDLFSILLAEDTDNMLLLGTYCCNQVDYTTILYCPKAEKDSAVIKIGKLHSSYVSGFLASKISSSTGLLNWNETVVTDSPPSPESVEFCIGEGEDELRVQIWKSPRVAVVKYHGEETWYKTARNDYETAVDMVLKYAE